MYEDDKLCLCFVFTDNFFLWGDNAFLEAALCFSPDAKADGRCSIALGLVCSGAISDLIGDTVIRGSQVLLVDDRKLKRATQKTK